MKTTNCLNQIIRSTIIKIFIFLNLLQGLWACAQSTGPEDKTLSPYFFVQSDNPGIDRLPLKSTSTEVNIAGMIADVSITQEYKNEGSNTLEAIYIFPASTQAAVYSMTMTIGEREIVAIVQEKEKARQQYEQAKEEGKSASLLEQQRPNVFQMNVANIMPGDLIKVEMHYTELLIPEEGVYEFVYPTVAGPRYSNQTTEDTPFSEKWVSNPYTQEGKDPFYTFDITVNLDAGLPVNDIMCSSHDVNINYDGAKTASIGLKNKNGNEGNRDFILRYRLTGNRIESGLLLYEGKEENFFLSMIQPPVKITHSSIPPREYVFIVDVSGSMNGFPLDVSKKLLRELIGNLQPNDRFNVLLFAGCSNILSSESLTANAANIQKAIAFIDRQQGGGGTELLPALKRALALKGTEDYSRTFIIATDGYVTIEKEAFDLIRNNLGNANFFAFGIGSSVNRHLIEGIAHVGMGLPFTVTKQEEAAAKGEEFRTYIQNPVLTNIKARYPGFDVYDIEPLNIPDVLSQRPVIIYGKYKGKATGKIILNGTTGSNDYSFSVDVDKVKAKKSNSAIKYLWAREKIRMLDDYQHVDPYDKEHKKSITKLGLKYNLLTNYTSFIAIDSEIRNNSGNMTTIKQPLPLPQGVSNYAVGGNMYKTKRHTPVVGYGSKQMETMDVAAEETTSTIKEDDKDETDAIYINPEKMAEFPGGISALKRFITKNIKYPQDMIKNGIEGTVYVQFIIDVDSTVKNLKILRGLHNSADKEAKRVILLTSKKWKPGEINGQSVKVSYTLPVKFSLD